MSTTIPSGSIAALGPGENALSFFDSTTGALLASIMLTNTLGNSAGVPVNMGNGIDVVADNTIAVERIPGYLNDSLSWNGWLFPNSPNANNIAFMGGIQGSSGGIYAVGSIGDQTSVFGGGFLNYEVGIDQYQSHIQLTTAAGAAVNYWRVNPAVSPGVNGDFLLVRPFALNPGATILYFTGTDRNSLSDGIIHAMDLTTGANLPDLVDESGSFPGATPFSLTVLPNGDIVAFWDIGSGTYTLKQYSAAGATLQTWTPTAVYGPIGQARALDSLSVWVSYSFPSGPHLDQIELSSGNVLQTLDISAPFSPSDAVSFVILPIAWTINAPVILSASLNCQTSEVTIIGVRSSFGMEGTISILDPTSVEVSGAIDSWSPDRVNAQMTYTTAGNYTFTVTPAGASTSAPFVQAFNCSMPVVTYPLRRQRDFMLPWDNANRRKFLDRIEFVMQAGIGDATTPNPSILLSLSKDGGKTFGPEMTLSAGAVGEYDRRVFLTRLGQLRNGVVRMIVTDPSDWQFVQCLIDYREGTH